MNFKWDGRSLTVATNTAITLDDVPESSREDLVRYGISRYLSDRSALSRDRADTPAQHEEKRLAQIRAGIEAIKAGAMFADRKTAAERLAEQAAEIERLKKQLDALSAKTK